MATLISIVHILTCIFLVVVVLLQTGKGADMGAVFGGSSATVFGSSGAGTFLGRLTAVMAAVFMLTSLTLTYLSSHRVSSTVFDSAPVSAPAPAQQPATGQPAPAPQAKANEPAAPAPVAPAVPAAAAPAAPKEPAQAAPAAPAEPQAPAPGAVHVPGAPAPPAPSK